MSEFTDSLIDGPQPQVKLKKGWSQRAKVHELHKLVRQANAIIRRGIKAADRQEWEQGQTQSEWIDEARKFLASQKLASEIEATQS